MKKFVEISSIVFLLEIAIYLRFAELGTYWPIWMAFYWFTIFKYLFILEIYIFVNNLIDRYIMLASMIVTFQYCVFNIGLKTKELHNYYEYLTSKNFTLVFLGTIAIVLIIVTISTKWKKYLNQ